MMNNQQVTPLGRKIVAAILGTTLLALVLSFALNMVPMLYSYRQVAADKASALGDLMATSLAAAVDFNDPDAAQESLHSLSLVPSVTGAVVYLGTGETFASYGIVPERPAGEQPPIRIGFSELLVINPIPAENANSFLLISVSLDDQWSMLKNNMLVGAIIFFCVFIFSSRLAGYFRRKLGGPLRQLTEVVTDISEERDYCRRVEYESNDEVGVLVTEFNSMLEKIEERDARLALHREHLEQTVAERTIQLQVKQQELMRNNRLLLSEIQQRSKAEMIREEVERINRHDLKSGLSLVIGYPELLLRDGNLTPEQEKMVKRIRAAGYRMLDMIRNHLNMFMMEKGIYSLRRQSVDLVETLCGLEEEFTPLLKSVEVRLDMDLNGNQVVGDESFVVSGDTPLLRAMLRNLIQNAIEASGPGDTVTISMNSGRKQQLLVRNSAQVGAEIRRRFFEKYVTHGKENGTGLGTYFAALIAKTHGASISMKTGPDVGTVITVVFRNEKRKKPALPQKSLTTDDTDDLKAGAAPL